MRRDLFQKNFVYAEQRTEKLFYLGLARHFHSSSFVLVMELIFQENFPDC